MTAVFSRIHRAGGKINDFFEYFVSPKKTFAQLYNINPVAFAPIPVNAARPFDSKIEIESVNVECNSFCHNMVIKKATKKWPVSLQESKALLLRGKNIKILICFSF